MHCRLLAAVLHIHNGSGLQWKLPRFTRALVIVASSNLVHVWPYDNYSILFVQLWRRKNTTRGTPGPCASTPPCRRVTRSSGHAKRAHGHECVPHIQNGDYCASKVTSGPLYVMGIPKMCVSNLMSTPLRALFGSALTDSRRWNVGV